MLFSIGLERPDGIALTKEVEAKDFQEALLTLLRLVAINRENGIKALALRQK